MKRCPKCNSKRVKKPSMFECRCVECGEEWGLFEEGFISDKEKKMSKPNVDLDKVASIRINEGVTMTIIPSAFEDRVFTVNIVDVNVNGQSTIGQSPVYMLKTILVAAGFKLSGGWLFVNQSGSFTARNSKLDDLISEKKETFHNALHLFGSAKSVKVFDDGDFDNGVVR